MRKGILGLASLLATFMIMAGVAFLLLWGLAKLLWNTDLDVPAARGIMVGVRVLVGIFGGAAIGWMHPHKRIGWGCVVGILYFALLFALRLTEWNMQVEDVEEVLILFVLCVCSPVIGCLLHFPRKKGFS